MRSAKQRNVFVILVATERLDARPANRISERLGGVPVLTSDQYNMYELVSILRSCHMMASSRYHGIVTSMPALVPSAGITMDERIRNLMRERGHQELLMTVDDPDLEPKLLAALECLGDPRRAHLRWHRPHGREESEVNGADGSVLRRGSPAALSRIRDAHGRVELGRLPAADERVAAAVGDSLQLVVPGLRTLMPFVGDIFSQLKAAPDVRVLQEIRDGQFTGVTGPELLELVRKARTFLAAKGLKKGDRCGILAANSIRWIAMDLAAMAEGLIVVPLYFRQAPAELVAMMKDSTPALSLLR